jgi:hypothetical protein
MTVLVITAWLVLQLPFGMLLGRLLQTRGAQPVAVPVAARHRRVAR